ncbi:MAG: phosphoribosylaminoimidazolesuccinocarboxamide synthase [Candidatus Magasanikbacteria bacterium]|nr:phosphoribosylaminoimidazolesuccinocarboxamide synthase [Candidatus Magasanikbacteria bacterium]
MRIAIIQFPGSNCEAETIRAVNKAGMQAESVFWNCNYEKLKEYDGFVIVGGFSYEDRSRAGIISALDPIMKVIFEESAKGKPILGICNGAQILVESGLVPGIENKKVALAINQQIKEGYVVGTGFFNDWVNIKVSAKCAFTTNLKEGEILRIPVAHAEGRFVFPLIFLSELEESGCTTFKYCDSSGEVRDDFPINPNGSIANLAAISNKDGNVMAIMPHPERCEEGQIIFISMREYIRQNKQNFLKFAEVKNNFQEKIELKEYKLQKNKYEIIVEEIITDNESYTVEQTLKNLGINAKISKQIHWEIECENISKEDLTQTGEFFNTNKEKLAEENYEDNFLLVQYKDDIYGVEKKENLEKNHGIIGLKKIKKGILWNITLDNKTELKSVLKTGIFYNKNSQNCYLYSKSMNNFPISGYASDLYSEIISKNIHNYLSDTNLNLQNKKKGKVRDIYDLDNNLLIVTTDRQSAFDRVLTHIPFKGQVLNQTSLWWFDQTQHIIPNHIIHSPDSNVILVKKCEPFKVEIIVRGYITGTTSTSAWTNYEKGIRNFCGNCLPEGMVKNQKFEEPIVTPTTKDEYDESISAKQIVERGLMSQEDWDYVYKKALEIFTFGQRIAKQNGLILVDTKYEFGKAQDGTIILIDEVHTPDSSRYWIARTYEDRFASGQEPENIDKEFLRLWFIENCNPYEDENLPEAPKDLVVELSRRYIRLYEMITGKEFKFPDMTLNLHNRIQENLKKYTAKKVESTYANIGLEEIKSEEIHKEKIKPEIEKITIKPKAILILGSISDEEFTKNITDELEKYGINFEQFVASAHKQPREVLQILDNNKDKKQIVYITIAGRSNALSGFVAGNSSFPVIACPPLKDKFDMMVNINSSLQMPSNVPVLTILDPKNTALAVKRIFDLCVE